MLSAFGAGLGLGVAAVVWVTRDLEGVPDRLYRDPTERVAGLVLGKRPMGETKRVEPVRTSTKGVKASDFAKPYEPPEVVENKAEEYHRLQDAARRARQGVIRQSTDGGMAAGE
jgi:hypothetical protein